MKVAKPMRRVKTKEGTMKVVVGRGEGKRRGLALEPIASAPS